MISMEFRGKSHSISTALISGLLLVAPVANSQAQSQTPILSTERPLLEMNLHSNGYKSHVRGKSDSWSIAFVDNDDLVLGWTTFDDPDAGKKTGYLTAAPSHLHAL